MKICVIGASGHYGYALGGLKDCEGAYIAGVAPGSVGENAGPAVKAAAAAGFTPEVFDSYADMVNKIKPDVAVVNCFFGDHARVISYLFKKGVHVFAEKPVSTTLEDLYSLKAAYDAAGVQLCPMFGIRYTPHFSAAKEAVLSGAVGEIRLINTQKSYKLGARGEHYKNRAVYGGTIPWVGSHAIDWIRWISGKRFVSVCAAHSDMFNCGHGDMEMSAACQFCLEDGVIATASIDYLRPDSAESHGDDRMRVAGTRGVLEVRGQKAYLINNEHEGTYELPLSPAGSLFADFYRRIKDGADSGPNFDDAFAVTEAALMARLSADEGRICYF